MIQDYAEAIATKRDGEAVVVEFLLNGNCVSMQRVDRGRSRRDMYELAFGAAEQMAAIHGVVLQRFRATWPQKRIDCAWCNDDGVSYLSDSAGCACSDGE